MFIIVKVIIMIMIRKKSNIFVIIESEALYFELNKKIEYSNLYIWHLKFAFVF